MSVRLAGKEALARLGVVNPLPMKGIRILSIDGGGMKGVIALEVLRRMEAESGKRIYEVSSLIQHYSISARYKIRKALPVSYTHLTLPTKA